jgi:hypothetical protein
LGALIYPVRLIFAVFPGQSTQENLINLGFRRSREGGNPVTLSQPVEVQRHWIPGIASRFRDDEQNQSISKSLAEPCQCLA